MGSLLHPTPKKIGFPSITGNLLTDKLELLPIKHAKKDNATINDDDSHSILCKDVRVAGEKIIISYLEIWLDKGKSKSSFRVYDLDLNGSKKYFIPNDEDEDFYYTISDVIPLENGKLLAVAGKFFEYDMEKLKEVLTNAVSAIEFYLKNDLAKAQNLFNK